MDIKTITIFGTSKTEPGDDNFQLAFELGKLLAQAGYTIVNGGYSGTMEAAAKGANSVGGKTIGVTCTAFGRKGPNEFVNTQISTDCLGERLEKLIELGDGYVVLPGGTGTLLELAEIWELTNKGFVNPPKPIILLTDFFAPLLDVMAAEDSKSTDCITKVDSPQDVIKTLKAISRTTIK